MYEKYVEALDIMQAVDDRIGEAQVLYRFGQLYARTDRFGDAVDALRRTLRLARELGDPIGQAYALHELGTVYQRQGRPEAERTLAEARQLADLTGVPIEDR